MGKLQHFHLVKKRIRYRLPITRLAYIGITMSAVGLLAVMSITYTRENIRGRVMNLVREELIKKATLQNSEIITNTSKSPDQLNLKLKSILTTMKRLHKPILVTVINDAYLPFAHNWLCNTINMDIHDQVLLIATDENSWSEVVSRWPQLNVISLSDDSFNGDQVFQHAGYLRIMVRRTELILDILKEGVETLLFDLDTFWISNPMPECERQIKGYDIAVIPVSSNPKIFCGGFIFMKPSDPVIQLWTKVADMMHGLNDSIEGRNDSTLVITTENDQNYVSKLLNEKFGGVRIKKLGLQQFPDGRWYNMKVSDREKLSPLVIHNNFIVGNQAKERRMRIFFQWFWDSETMTCNLDLVARKTNVKV